MKKFLFLFSVLFFVGCGSSPSTDSQDFKDYMNAIENQKVSKSEQAKLMKPFYEKYKSDNVFGAETSFNYGITNLWAGNFEEGKRVMDIAYKKYKNDEEYGGEFLKVQESLNLWENLEEYDAYENAVLSKDFQQALPIILDYHNKYKNNSFLNGETYYNLILTYVNLDQEVRAEKLLEEGLGKYPNNLDLQKIYDAANVVE